MPATFNQTVETQKMGAIPLSGFNSNRNQTGQSGPFCKLRPTRVPYFDFGNSGALGKGLVYASSFILLARIRCAIRGHSIDVSCAWISEPLHESLCDWGDPWVDPQGILGGSNPNSRDPATLTRVKIGGSSETTSPLYNIKKGDQ